MQLLPPIKVFYDKIANREYEITSVQHLLVCKSQGFGERPEVYKDFGLIGHNGLDWGLKEGTPIHAAHGGRVVYSGGDQKAGIGVTVQDSEKKTIYWHLSKTLVPVGINVDAGDIIGSSGNTGFSTGPHLHFGVKLMKDGTVLNRDNGYDGCVDPSSYFVWPSSSDSMTQEEVRNLYRLAFYREPDAGELSHWTGKPLSEFLKVAISDRAAFLQKP